MGVAVALHSHSGIWAACMEAEGGEGDSVLHSSLRIERLMGVIGRLVIEGGIVVTDVSVGHLCWNKGPLAQAKIYNVDHWKEEEATGLGTAAGLWSIGIHGSRTVRPSCCCHKPQCFGELVVGRCGARVAHGVGVPEASSSH